jgi:hypothetical protein
MAAYALLGLLAATACLDAAQYSPIHGYQGLAVGVFIASVSTL